MSKKRFTAEQIIGKLLEAEVLQSKRRDQVDDLLSIESN